MGVVHAVVVALIAYGAYFVLVACAMGVVLFVGTGRLESLRSHALDQEIADLLEGRLPPA